MTTPALPRMTRALLLAAAASVAACSTAPAPETGSAPSPAGGAQGAAGFPTTPPAPGPPPALSLPNPVRRTLPNGLEVVYVRHGSLPVVHATLLAPTAGMAVDSAALPGLAAFTSEMLDEGAGGRSALDLSGALEQLGATLSTNVGWDAAYVDLHVLRDRLPQALPLMADVVARPDFPEAEVRRVREERITELTSARDVPGVIAANAVNSLIYTAQHPYGRLATVESTRQITRETLRGFHQARYRPGGATLILVGDVNPDQLHPAVERAFGGWTGSATRPSPASFAAYPQRTTIYLVDKPGAAQSEIRIGHTGVSRSNPDYFALTVLNTILGGSFTSRLNTNLRETHGFSYGASSSFSMRLGAGPFVAGSAVFTAKTDSAVAEFFKELRRIREESVTPEELQRAKNFVALGLPRRFETTETVAAQLAQMEIYDLPADFYNTFVPRLMAVTAADVQRVAREYVHPTRSVVVVVGDRQQVEAGLRGLNLGAVELRQVEEFVR